MANRFKLDPKGLAEFSRSVQFQRWLEDIAREVEAAAKALAPVGEAPPDAENYEHYHDMIHATVAYRDGKFFVRLSAHKYTSHWIEFGTSKMPARAVLRRAVEQLGLQVKGDKQLGVKA